MSAARRLARGSRLVLATHNPGKLREIAALLAPCGVDVVSAGQLGLPEPEETAPDFVGNARLKALAATASGLPALSDDSGFCVAALGGAPGVVSARWAGPEKDFGRAMQRVWDEVGEAAPGRSATGRSATGRSATGGSATGGSGDRRAWFVCALCLAWPDGQTATYLGRAEGTLVWPPRGALGFGYDPMFVPAGGSATYGEMAPDDKHAISHRAAAMAQLLAACFDLTP